MRFIECHRDGGRRTIRVEEIGPKLRFNPEMLAWFGDKLTLYGGGVFTIACENAHLTYELAGYDASTGTHIAKAF